MPPAPFRRAVPITAFCAAALTVAFATTAASSSGGAQFSSARLIAGGSAEGGGARAGLEIKLAPGWKTYWRYPGDSGVPPRFDFAGSDNVVRVEVLWPAPMRFEDLGGTSIGYAKDVVLPLRVALRDPSAPATLRAHVEYAICEKVCVPIEARVDLRLDGKGGEAMRIAESEKRVPRLLPLGADAPLAVASMRKESGKPERVVVDVRASAGDSVDLFAEGPDAEWSLPLPVPEKDAPAGIRRFAFALDGAPPGKSFAGVPIKLTAVGRQGATETVVRLD